MTDETKPIEFADPDARLPALRRRLSIDGIEWTVRLYVSRYDRRSRPDLLFESDWAVRRVRDYPADWHELSDEHLYQVSGRR